VILNAFAVPEQFPIFGVTVTVVDTAAVPVLAFAVKAEILPVPVCAGKPTADQFASADHEYVTAGEVTVVPNVICLTVPPLHAGTSLTVFTAGTGFTTTFTSCVLSHPFAVTVTLYVTVTALAVVLFSVSFIVAELPLPAGFDMPDTNARVHLNVAPDVVLVAV
jgi:hypothetical protein